MKNLIFVEEKIDETIRCPRCGSENVEGGKKGFGVGKAITDAILTGGFGLAAGLMGRNKLQYTCLRCGYKWDPAKEEMMENLALRKAMI